LKAALRPHATITPATLLESIRSVVNFTKLNKAKEAAISRLVDVEREHPWGGGYGWNERLRKREEETGEYEALLGFVVFLTLIVKHLRHPEMTRRGTGSKGIHVECDFVRPRKFLELRKLRS
jgi:hypothetical protein